MTVIKLQGATALGNS